MSIEADYLLQQVIESANRDDGDGEGMGITLTTTGGIVSGYLISRSRWRRLYLGESQEQRMADVAEKEQEYAQKQDDLKEALLSAIEASDLDNPNLYSGVKDMFPEVGFVHLREARFSGGNGLMPAEGCIWRGSLRHVVGWTVGVLTSGEPSA
ncbi:hypothetical protein [Jannaschia sp. R86511]|uniref:hypothetical protein n=1 Tax=Jannaschia sp. R86511 TaxID=3093853 RepID=UPI0036D218EE